MRIVRSLLGVPLLMASLAIPVAAQHPPRQQEVVEGSDFRVYDAKGRSKSFAEIVEAMRRADVVLVGESHDDVVGHGVEAELFVRGAQRVGAVGDAGREDSGEGRPVVLSLEMFERDVQYIVDEYLDDLITEDQFKKSSRPWDRYDTDYRRLVEFAKAHELPVVAANAPRRYVNRVSRLGPASLEKLSETARAFLPPLPYPGASEEYAAQWNALMAEMMQQMRAPRDTSQMADEEMADDGMADDGMTEPDEAGGATAVDPPPPPTHDLSNALHAQALWDAAMGNAITGALEAHPGALVIHFAGSFHVQRGTGIPERVADYRKGAKVLSVVLAPADDIDAWDDDEHKGLGDFVVLTKKPQSDGHAEGSL